MLAVKKQHIQKVNVAEMRMLSEMRMLRWINGSTFKDRIKTENIQSKLGVTPIDDKMRENCLRWFGHIHGGS